MLYHYTSYASIIQIVTSRTIWASNIHYLSDGSEFGYAFGLVRDHLEEIEKREPFRRTFFDIVRDRLAAIERVNVFVASFSSSGDLLSQWRAYCPSSRGVSFGVAESQLADVCVDQGFDLVPCIYDVPRQRAVVAKAIDDLLREHDGAGKADDMMFWIAHGFSRTFKRLAPQFKDPAFAEEQEWRLVSQEIDPSHPQVKYRQGLSFVVPYFEFNLPVRDELLQCDEFIIGPTPHPALAEESLTAMLHARRVKWNIMRRSAIPYRAW